MDNSGAPQHGRLASEFSPSAEEITCRQFVELVTHYLEGALDARTLAQVEEHLVMCDWCVTYGEQFQATIAALRGLREPAAPQPPETVLAALRARRSA